MQKPPTPGAFVSASDCRTLNLSEGRQALATLRKSLVGELIARPQLFKPTSAHGSLQRLHS